MDFVGENSVCRCMQSSNWYWQKTTQSKIPQTLSTYLGWLPRFRLAQTNLWYLQQGNAQEKCKPETKFRLPHKCNGVILHWITETFHIRQPAALHLLTQRTDKMEIRNKWSNWNNWHFVRFGSTMGTWGYETVPGQIGPRALKVMVLKVNRWSRIETLPLIEQSSVGKTHPVHQLLDQALRVSWKGWTETIHRSQT